MNLKDVPDDELFAEVARREQISSKKKRELQYAQFRAHYWKGITTKDFVIRYHYEREDDQWMYGHVYILGDDGKEYDSYYDVPEALAAKGIELTEEEDQEEDFYDEINSFIDIGAEACENCYEILSPDYTDEASFHEHLKKCGYIHVYRMPDGEDIDWKNEPGTKIDFS